MLIPIRDDNPTTRRAYVTLGLIAANVLVFLLWQPSFKSATTQQFFFFCHAEIPWETTHQESLAEGGPEAVRAIDDARIGISGRALQLLLQGHTEQFEGLPPELRNFEGCPHKSWWESVFVAMFLHGGWLHIGGNMLYLWVFGNNIEDKLGPFKYLLFYLGAGIAAAALQTATGPNSVLPSLGASGAIAGVLGAYLVMFPKRRVVSLVFFFFITLISLPALVVLGFWFVLQALSGVTTSAQHVSGGVAYFAHIGGFLFGALLALALFPKEWRVRRDPGELPPW